MEIQPFDADYIQRLVADDPATIEHFAKYFGGLLTLKLRNRLRDPQALEDVRQETFVRVLRHLRSRGDVGEHPERLGAFVNAIANNVMFETIRNRGRQLPPEQIEPAAQLENPEAGLLKFEREAVVRRLLQELPPKDRELLHMVFIEERDKDEVCRTLGVDRNYLRVLLHRATERLRASYRRSVAETKTS